ncbi:MAG: acyl-coenzyme A thioesterase PaaI-like protein, partial [Dinoroseobacter sp.]
MQGLRQAALQRKPKMSPVMDPEAKAKIARQFIEAIPFSRALNMKLDEIGNGLAVISMPYDVRLIGDPTRGVIHGGA